MRKGLAAAAGLLAAAAFATSSAVAQEGPPQGGDQQGEDVHVFKGRVVSVDANAGTLQVQLAPKPCKGRRGGRHQGQGDQQGQGGQQGQGSGEQGEGQQGPSGFGPPRDPSGQQYGGRPQGGPGAQLSRRGKRCRRGRRPSQGQQSPQQGEGQEQGQGQVQSSGNGGRHGRTVTVSIDTDTKIRRNGQSASLADLQAGDKVRIVIVTDEETGPRQALNSPADIISARSAPAQTPSQNGGGS